jgi:purine nucleoside phosphorylase
MKRVAIIGGTGFTARIFWPMWKRWKRRTPYGSPVTLKVGSYSNLEVVFLARHG